MNSKFDENMACYGIMQPYFLPYLGYFSIIKHTDKWVVLDEVQYKKQSWGNRNRVIKNESGLSWITVPIKKMSRSSVYAQIEIQNNIDWKPKILNQLDFYRQNAPNYNVVMELMHKIFEFETDSLVDLNIHALFKLCEFLDIPFNYTKLSEMDFDKSSVRYTGDWGLQVCKKVKADSYINPYMGHSLFNEVDWKKEGIDLKFLMYNDTSYHQTIEPFQGSLSIVDALMWNSKEEIHNLLDDINICDLTYINSQESLKI